MRGYFYTGPSEAMRSFTESMHEDGRPDFQFPTTKVVCGRCRGEGTQDCFEGGMTSSEMDEQGPEFFEDYMSGMYSVPCEECGGANVVNQIDEDQMDPGDLKEWDAWCESIAASNAESAAERAMGA